MDVSQLKPKTATIPTALAYFLFSKKRFIKLAVEHDFANNLRSAVTRNNWEAKEWPIQSEVDSWFQQKTERLMTLRREFWGSALMTLSLAIVGIWLSALIGTPVANAWAPKHLAAIGGLLAAWGTIFQLAYAPQTWRGKSIFELIRPQIFLLLFMPGSVLAIAGTLA